MMSRYWLSFSGRREFEGCIVVAPMKLAAGTCSFAVDEFLAAVVLTIEALDIAGLTLTMAAFETRQ